MCESPIEPTINLCRQMELAVTRTFYIRSHFTARPISEILRRYPLDLPENILKEIGLPEGDSKARKRAFEAWAGALNNRGKLARMSADNLTWLQKPENVELFDKIKWSVVKLQGRLKRWAPDWEKDKLNNGSFKEIPSPLLLADLKEYVLRGNFADNYDATVINGIKEDLRAKGFSEKLISTIKLSVRIWFLDWHSGGIDFRINFEIGTQDDLEKIDDLSDSVLARNTDSFFPIEGETPLSSGSNGAKAVYTKDEVVDSVSNKLGRLLYSTFLSLLKPEKNQTVLDDNDAPCSIDKHYMKRYWDYSRNLVCYRMPNLNGDDFVIPIPESNLKAWIKKFVSGDILDGMIEKIGTQEIDLIAHGLNGCAALLNVEVNPQTNYPWLEENHDLELTKLHLQTLWKLALVYFAGLSKLSQNLVKLSLRLSSYQAYDKFLEEPEIKNFPEYRLRLQVYMNECLFSINGGTDLELKVYGTFWKTLKGDELNMEVRGQIDQIAAYIEGRKEQHAEEESEARNRKIVLLTIYFSVISLFAGNATTILGIDTKADPNTRAMLALGLLLIAIIAPIYILILHRWNFFQRAGRRSNT